MNGRGHGAGLPTQARGRLAAKLKANHYDLVIDMHGQFRSALLTLAPGNFRARWI